MKLSWKAFTVLKYVLLLLLVVYMLYALSKASPSPLPCAVLSCNWGHQQLQRKWWNLICTGFGRWERQGEKQMCNGRIFFLSLEIGVIGISPLLAFLYSQSKEFLLSHFCYLILPLRWCSRNRLWAVFPWVPAEVRFHTLHPPVLWAPSAWVKKQSQRWFRGTFVTYFSTGYEIEHLNEVTGWGSGSASIAACHFCVGPAAIAQHQGSTWFCAWFPQEVVWTLISVLRGLSWWCL